MATTSVLGGRRIGAAELDGVVASLAEHGVATIEGVLEPGAAAHVLDRLWASAGESVRRGIPTRFDSLDPNEANVRVFNLIDLDPVFAELIQHPVADTVVRRLLGEAYIVSNFSANIARPGSGSMVVHSDQAAVMPEPWLATHTANIIWCLTDVRAENGATLHLPGSQGVRTVADLPEDPVAHMVPFEAPAGSIIVMEGRIWHTSGRNVTADEDRALLFGYYTQPFVRPQWNFSVGLRPEVQAAFDEVWRYRLGLDVGLNVPPLLPPGRT